MRLKHIFTNYEMMKMMHDGIDDIDEPNNWNLYGSPCQYRHSTEFIQGKKRCQARFNTFVKLILQCFQGLPQEGDLGSVLELFKLTFHSQAPWFTKYWEALFKGLEFFWSSFWSLSEQYSLSVCLRLIGGLMFGRNLGFPLWFSWYPCCRSMYQNSVLF